MDNITKNYIDNQIRRHIHDGNFSQRINVFDLFGAIPSSINTETLTVATTGNTDTYIIAPITGIIKLVDFSGTTTLATSDTNYVTFSITNLGQAGAGSTAILSATDTNTTKTTGGSAITANTKRTLLLSSVLNANNVVEGDRLLIRAAATGTLANTVTFGTYIIRFT